MASDGDGDDDIDEINKIVTLYAPRRRPFVSLAGDLLEPYEWVIDEFIYCGVMTIVGGHGAGKTTSLVPICLNVCGALRQLSVSRPRKVLYVAEDLSQVKRMVHGAIARQRADQAWIEDNFFILQAERLPVTPPSVSDTHVVSHADIAATARDLITVVDTPNGPQSVYPLIVLDTISANLAIDNENDNSEVGQTVAALRDVYRGFPLWLVHHVSKAVQRNDVSTASSRGATAWDADVEGNFYIFVDEDKRTRVLYGASPMKRRDPGRVSETAMTGKIWVEQREDRFGEIQEVPYLAVDLQESSTEARTERRAQEKEAAAERQYQDNRESVLDYLREQFELRDATAEIHPLAQLPTRRGLERKFKGIIPRQKLRNLLDDLFEAGLVNIANGKHIDESGRQQKVKYYVAVVRRGGGP